MDKKEVKTNIFWIFINRKSIFLKTTKIVFKQYNNVLKYCNIWRFIILIWLRVNIWNDSSLHIIRGKYCSLHKFQTTFKGFYCLPRGNSLTENANSHTRVGGRLECFMLHEQEQDLKGIIASLRVKPLWDRRYCAIDHTTEIQDRKKSIKNDVYCIKNLIATKSNLHDLMWIVQKCWDVSKVKTNVHIQ